MIQQRRNFNNHYYGSIRHSVEGDLSQVWLTMIDVTYKTTNYDIPLFFLTVRTNAGYTVVAEFIVQVETAAHIEALTILKKWNPTWQPKFIMCDYSEAEIMSMKSAFPSTWTHRNRRCRSS